MKITFSFYGSFVLTVITVLTSGCVQNRISLVEKGLVSTETTHGEHANILWTDVYQDSKGVIVYGVVQRAEHTNAPITAHLDITVLASDRTILQEVRTPQISLPRCSIGKAIPWKRFKVRIPEIPADSKIMIAAHSGEHKT